MDRCLEFLASEFLDQRQLPKWYQPPPPAKGLSKAQLDPTLGILVAGELAFYQLPPSVTLVPLCALE